MPKPIHADLYQGVTQAIVAAIEAGAGEYQMPWNTRLCFGTATGLPCNPIGRYGYKGINILSLWCSQQIRSYPTTEWATFRQWQSAGAKVRKGEKGTLTVFYKPVVADKRAGADDDDAQSRSRCFVARAAYVFNAAQVDGYMPPTAPPLPEIERHTRAEELIAASNAAIQHSGPNACYLPSRDEIHLPPPGAFHSSAGYYGVALHELTHWTGHQSRCARDLRGRFGTEAYAMEELVAELGAAFLSAEIGLAAEPRIDHAQYIESWLKVLKGDKRAIFTAAAKASQAATFLTELAAGRPNMNESLPAIG